MVKNMTVITMAFTELVVVVVSTYLYIYGVAAEYKAKEFHIFTVYSYSSDCMRSF
jgi:hypothetical protein